MEALQKENALYKGYIATLEKQNQARNIERNTLFSEIDRLVAENDRLQLMLSSSSSKVVVSSNSEALEKQIKQHKDNNLSLSREIDNLRSKLSQSINDLKNKDAQIVRYNSEKQAYLSEIAALKDSQTATSASRSQLVILQSEIASYKIKVSQMTSLEQNQRNSLNKISQLEMTIRKWENDFKRIEGDNKKLEADFKKIEIQNRQLRSNNNNRSSSEMSSLLSAKLNLEATIRQLNGKIEWLEGSNRGLEQERSELEKRMREVERDLLQSKGKLMQFKMNEDSFKNSEANILIKEKEMEALEQMIGSLKENKRYLEKTVKEKDDVIANIEAQLYSLKTSKNESEQTQREMNELRSQKVDLQRQISSLIKINQEHETNNYNFAQNEKNWTLNLNSLREDRDRLLKEKQIQNVMLEEVQRELRLIKNRNSELISHQSPPVPIYRSNVVERDHASENQDLRMIVEKLRVELDELKYSPQFKSNHFSEAQLPSFDSQQKLHLMHMQNMPRKEKSPIRGGHSKLHLHNERDREAAKRQKWQTLQKKISILRNENQSLKRSLFD